MRLALISDIHGNDIALERVIASIDSDGSDGIVCLGDVAGTGPQPGAALERMRAIGAPVVMGNVDSYMLYPESVGSPGNEMAARFWDIDEWCVEQLPETSRSYMARFEATVDVDLGDGISALCYHGSPKSFDDPVLPTTPDDQLADFLDGHGHAIFAGGHTHFAMVRRIGAAFVVNPGSVGLAYDRTQPADEIRFAPWAEYALITARRARCVGPILKWKLAPVFRSQLPFQIEGAQSHSPSTLMISRLLRRPSNSV